MGGCASKKSSAVEDDRVKGVKPDLPRSTSCKPQPSSTGTGPQPQNAARLAWQASARSLSMRLSRRRQASYRIRKNKNITFSADVDDGESEGRSKRIPRRGLRIAQTEVTSVGRSAPSDATGSIDDAAGTPDAPGDMHSGRSCAELLTHPSTRRRRGRTATETSVDSVVHCVAAALAAEKACVTGQVPDDLGDSCSETDLYDMPPMVVSMSAASTAKQRWARVGTSTAAAGMLSRRSFSKAWMSTIVP